MMDTPSKHFNTEISVNSLNNNLHLFSPMYRLEWDFKMTAQSIFDYTYTLVCLIFFQKLFFTVRQSTFSN